MTLRRATTRARPSALRAAALVLALAAAAPALAAQQREFAAQDVLVPAFEGANIKLSRALGDEVRSRLLKLVDKRDVNVISGGRIDDALYRAGFDERKPIEAPLIRSLAKSLRADEYVRGTAERTRDGVRVKSELVLTRETRLIQPLPTIVGKDVDDAGARLAQAIVEARRQMIPQRRCENAVRLGDAPAAIAAARAGIAAYPKATIARVCLVVASLMQGTGADEILRAAQAVLDELPDNYWALEAVAQAYDALNERDKAARAWMKVLATDSTNLELVAHVGQQLSEHNNSLAAEALILKVSDAHKDDMALQRVRWDVLYRNKRWTPALEVGARLAEYDSASRGDPQFHLRLATAYKNAGQPVTALMTAARGVSAFPDDTKLYELYAQFVRDESPVVVSRGLEAFPKSAPLNVMLSRDLKAKGNAADALAASKRALTLDPTLQHGFLQLAQSQLELGQPDSALASLHVALATGEDSSTVAQFTLARGNALFRSAGQSQQRDEFTRAFRYLAYADSLRPSVQTQFLYGASALSVLQGAAADAPTQKSCDLARQAQSLVPLATEKLTAGAVVAPDAVRQYLARLDTMAPVIEKQVGALCSAAPASLR